MEKAPAYSGTVVALHVNTGVTDRSGSLVPKAIEFIEAGASGLSQYREEIHERRNRSRKEFMSIGDPLAESPVANRRTWSGASIEDHTYISRKLGVPVLTSDTGLNLVVEGIPHFSILPAESQLFFPERQGTQARLTVCGPNHPCAYPGLRVAERERRPQLAAAYQQVANARYGVIGLVGSPGRIEVGDRVELILPKYMYSKEMLSRLLRTR